MITAPMCRWCGLPEGDPLHSEAPEWHAFEARFVEWYDMVPEILERQMAPAMVKRIEHAAKWRAIVNGALEQIPPPGERGEDVDPLIEAGWNELHEALEAWCLNNDINSCPCGCDYPPDEHDEARWSDQGELSMCDETLTGERIW